MIDKITFKRNIRYLSEILTTVAVCAIFLAYSFYAYPISEFHEFGRIALCAFLFFFIPQLFLHMSYLIVNKSMKFKYLAGDKFIIIWYKDIEKKIDFADIKSIELIKTPAFEEKRICFFPWEIYHYAVIKLHGNERILLTCLLVEEFYPAIDVSKIVFKTSLYPNIPLGYIFDKSRIN